MQYDIDFDSGTRQMTYNGRLAITVGDDGTDVLHFIFIDPDNLLDGYKAYCVFDGAVKRELIDNDVTIPSNVLIGTRLRVQLMFCKDNLKFYSLNILTIRLNKVISR